MPTLTIVIPALDEEDAIGGTIERCLAAKEEICKSGGVSDVEVIVVSDGSTDRTVEIAQSYSDVQVIVFERNRGYGAAIKEGWRQGSGDFMGFLDADGTCDPKFFATLCRAVDEQSADVVLGSRLGPDSKMPRIRRIGNRIFALMLSLLCGRWVTDTASGMRVIRRSSLPDLLPLPDGLHFTPSMSAHALLNNMVVVELPMTYEERIGRSKLNVIQDGIRFFKTIIDGVLCYRPEKLFLIVFWLCMALGISMSIYPTYFYFQHRELEEWMIYRFVACFLLGSFQLMLLLTTALVNQMALLTSRREEANMYWPSLIAKVINGWCLTLLILTILGISTWILWPGIVDYVTTGKVYLHWSRLVAGAFGLFSVVQLAIFSVLMKVISIWNVQRRALESEVE